MTEEKKMPKTEEPKIEEPKADYTLTNCTELQLPGLPTRVYGTDQNGETRSLVANLDNLPKVVHHNHQIYYLKEKLNA